MFRTVLVHHQGEHQTLLYKSYIIILGLLCMQIYFQSVPTSSTQLLLNLSVQTGNSYALTKREGKPKDYADLLVIIPAVICCTKAVD
jgi:hypothetical protein